MAWRFNEFEKQRGRAVAAQGILLGLNQVSHEWRPATRHPGLYQSVKRDVPEVV